jgi:hypothetical protein
MDVLAGRIQLDVTREDRAAQTGQAHFAHAVAQCGRVQRTPVERLEFNGLVETVGFDDYCQIEQAGRMRCGAGFHRNNAAGSRRMHGGGDITLGRPQHLTAQYQIAHGNNRHRRRTDMLPHRHHITIQQRHCTNRRGIRLRLVAVRMHAAIESEQFPGHATRFIMWIG